MFLFKQIFYYESLHIQYLKYQKNFPHLLSSVLEKINVFIKELSYFI